MCNVLIKGVLWNNTVGFHHCRVNSSLVIKKERALVVAHFIHDVIGNIRLSSPFHKYLAALGADRQVISVIHDNAFCIGIHKSIDGRSTGYVENIWILLEKQIVFYGIKDFRTLTEDFVVLFDICHTGIKRVV